MSGYPARPARRPGRKEPPDGGDPAAGESGTADGQGRLLFNKDSRVLTDPLTPLET